MRIVHVITRLILGGAQENTLLTCREQAAAGHDVILLTGPPLGPEGSLLEVAQGLPIRTILIPEMRRAVHPYRDAVAYEDLLKNLRDLGPDVVHTHSSKAGILGRRAGRSAGVRCVVHTIHGLPFDEYQAAPVRWAYRAVERRAARWSHRLIAVCADMADRAAAAGIAPRESIEVVYSAIDAARFRAAAGRRDALRAAWGAGPETFVFAKVARLFPMKGHAFVLPAFARVLGRCPAAMLVLAGEGVLRASLGAQARRLGVADRVRFLGLVPREDMPGVLWASDAVVHASLREGLARVLPEAGLCGRPVISYDIGGAREVVRDGAGGVLLAAPPPGALAENAAGPLAEAMLRLASDPQAARALGLAWPAKTLAPFDAPAATARILRVYESVLGV
jgi:glycosyltransferase involved in cell wall biosynthesis